MDSDETNCFRSRYTHTEKTERGKAPSFLSLPLSLSHSFPSSPASADPVPRDQAELRAVLEEDVARGLRGVDADAVVGDDGRGGWGDLELFRVFFFRFVFGFFVFEVERSGKEKRERKRQ